MTRSKSTTTQHGSAKHGYWLAAGISILAIGTSLVRAEIVTIDNQSATQNHEHRVSEVQHRAISKELRVKTGLESLRFDENGVLTYDRTESANGGSATLRHAITGAIEDRMNIFHLVDYSRSKAIQFAEIDRGTQYMNSRITTYQIKIDFADFKESRRYTPKEVMQAFTVGLALFHEIDHKVGYDPENPLPEFKIRPDKSSIGIRGVIENTNKIRKELSLMLRKSNQHRGRPYKGSVWAFRNTQEIQFFDESGKRKSLRWKLQKK